MSAPSVRVIDHFWLLKDPFDPDAGPRSWIPTAPVRAALANLNERLAREQPVSWLSGAPGSGKSIAAELFLQNLGQGVRVARVRDASAAWPEIRASLEDQLGLAPGELTGRRLAADGARGHRTVIAWDQAERLSMQTLEAFIATVEDWPAERGARRVHCLFVAEEGGTEPVHAWLARNASPSIRLARLDPDETAAYMRRRITLAASGDREVFTRAASEAVFVFTGGVPREIDSLSREALSASAQAGARYVGDEEVEAAAARLGLARVAQLPEPLEPALESSPSGPPAADPDREPPSPRARAGSRANGPDAPIGARIDAEPSSEVSTRPAIEFDAAPSPPRFDDAALEHPARVSRELLLVPAPTRDAVTGAEDAAHLADEEADSWDLDVAASLASRAYLDRSRPSDAAYAPPAWRQLALAALAGGLLASVIVVAFLQWGSPSVPATGAPSFVGAPASAAGASAAPPAVSSAPPRDRATAAEPGEAEAEAGHEADAADRRFELPPTPR